MPASPEREVRFHGRGGQGVVSAAALLSIAAFEEGHFAQAFPSFGSERTGAPVEAYCRLSATPIRLREPVLEPDVLVVLDPTLVHHVDLLTGLHDASLVLVNSAHPAAELDLGDPERQAGLRIETVAASEIARQELGRPLANVAMLGALAAVTGLVSIDAIASATRHFFPGAVGEANARAARRVHHELERLPVVLGVRPDA